METQEDSYGIPLFSNPQLTLEDLPTVSAVEWTGLSSKYLQVQMWSLWLVRITILLFFLLYSFVYPNFPAGWRWPVAGGWIFLLIISTLIRYYGFRIKGYAVRAHDIMYRTGLIFRKTTVIPYNRIQHSEIQRGLIERQFFLATLAIYTAGGSQSDLAIPGLTEEQAERIRTFLSKKAEEEEEE